MRRNQKLNPLFSIVTCTKNSERFVLKNIRSVMAQTLKDYEHIFIDGYSRDGTINLIKEYQLKFPNRVRLYRVKPMGISNAMNVGIRRANGKYIFILHSDDSLYNKDVLKRVFSYLKNNSELDWIYGKIQVIESWGEVVGVFPKQKIFQLSNNAILKLFNFVPHQSVFMKRSIFNKFGLFDESLKSSMDYDMWLRIAPKTRWMFMNRIISNYMIHKGSQSSDKSKSKVNKDESIKVAKTHLNGIELILHLLVKVPMDAYNHTHR